MSQNDPNTNPFNALPTMTISPGGSYTTGTTVVASSSYLIPSVTTSTSPYWSNLSTFGTPVSSPVSSPDDVIIDGTSLKHTLKTIQDRLAILDNPTPEKLEKYAALKEAYQNYKLLESLIGDGDNLPKKE